jgi:hypothetical protein
MDVFCHLHQHYVAIENRFEGGLHVHSVREPLCDILKEHVELVIVAVRSHVEQILAPRGGVRADGGIP